MVLDQVHEDLLSGPFRDVLIWLSSLPQSKVDDFCNGFVEDSFRALAQHSDRLPDKVAQPALPFLHAGHPVMNGLKTYRDIDLTGGSLLSTISLPEESELPSFLLNGKNADFSSLSLFYDFFDVWKELSMSMCSDLRWH